LNELAETLRTERTKEKNSGAKQKTEGTREGDGIGSRIDLQKRYVKKNSFSDAKRDFSPRGEEKSQAQGKSNSHRN